MSKREASVSRREYTDEFEQVAVRRSESVGGHQAANRLGIPRKLPVGDTSRRLD